MREVSKKDWKLFREKVPGWQEAYMDRLNKEYIELLNEDDKASEKFWRLEKKIREDKKKSGVILDMRRSMFYANIFSLIHEGVIMLEDLDEFSDDLRETVRFMLGNHAISDL